MIYAIIGAVFVGLSLGLFGSGGSILTVPILKYLFHHDDKTAIAESLAIVGGIALLTVIPYAKAKLIEWRVALLFGVPGVIGTYGGAWLSAFVEGFVQLLVFAVVMLSAAIMMWRAKPPHTIPSSKAAHQTSISLIALEGLVIGMLTGFVGVGGGFLIVPALVLLAGLPMRTAVATSLVIIAAKSAVGFGKYVDVLEGSDASIDWPLIAIFITVGAVGSFAGRTLSTRINQHVLKRCFAVFLVVMSLFMLVREGSSLFAS